jgi:hypothetical protein
VADSSPPPGVLGLVKGWDNPAWIDNRHTMVFNPGADSFPEGVNVAYHELGHADPSALDDMHHAYTWFDDAAASYIVFGDITRRGDKLAVGEDGFSVTRTIRLYSVGARPPYKDDAPTYRCRLGDPPPARATNRSAGHPTGRRSPTRPAATSTRSTSARSPAAAAASASRSSS